jgi:hypothetical protein
MATTQAPPRQVQFDPDLAHDVAVLLTRGLHPNLIAFQLRNRADEAVIAAYVQDAQNNPYFRGVSSLREDLLKREWVLNCVAKSARHRSTGRGVTRLRKPDPAAFVRDYVGNQQPAVLEGLVDDWAALTRWDHDYLEQAVGRETMVEAQKGRNSVEDYEIAKGALRSTIPFGEVIDHLRGGEASNDLYLTANNGNANRQAFDPLWRDFSPVIDGFTVPQPGNDGFLWIGPKGTVTPFHHDLTDNLLTQVKGRKRVHLIPNWEEKNMKTFNRIFSGWKLEELQAEGVDIPVFETVIGPGDMLFIPVGWWHHVVSLDESYSILLTNTAWSNDYTNEYLP